MESTKIRKDCIYKKILEDSPRVEIFSQFPLKLADVEIANPPVTQQYSEQNISTRMNFRFRMHLQISDKKYRKMTQKTSKSYLQESSTSRENESELQSYE